MKFFKPLLDLYINSSIHVAFACFAFLKITYFSLNIPLNNSVLGFAFFGTIMGYNFVKFDALARANKKKMKKQLKIIAMISFVALVFTVYFFFGLATITKLIALFFLLLTILYTLPFFPNRTNARNWAGLKIYIVAFCWVGVTVFLPIINTDAKLNSIFYLYSTQRFLIVFILILLFEIIDIKNDDPHLKTLPQQIGVKNTKNLGYLLLMVYCGLSFLYSNFGFPLLELELSFWVTLIIALFLFFANENRSKYYTLFWVESIPILWLLLLFWN